MIRIVASGNLGADPEVKTIQNGNVVCNFRMAIRDWRAKEGESPMWLGVVVWGKHGEKCGEMLTKGSKVLVSGRLTERHWQDRDGNDRASLEIADAEVEFLDPRPAGQSQGEGRGRGAPAPAGTRGASANPPPPAEDEIPF